MTRLYSVFILLIVLVSFDGCDVSETKTGKGSLIDYGFIPADVTINPCFQQMIFNKNSLFVGTSDGIWECNITTCEWSKCGLEGMKITSLYKHPEIEDRFFAGVSSDNTSTYKTLYISEDGGTNWHTADAPVFDSLDDHYEDYYCFAARPGYPEQIYTNLVGGTMIAVSTDYGETWHRCNYAEESYISDPCNIVFLPDNPDVIFQGAESPLDDAWLGRYDINNNDPVILESFTKLVNSSIWSNRRPNELQTYDYAGQNIYIGLEGALAKVNGNSSTFIFKCEAAKKETNSDETLLYTYVKGIWVDPENTRHILFGGQLNNDVQPMQLYETYDEGATIDRYTDIYGMENPCLIKIVPTATLPALLFKDQHLKKVKVLLFNNDSVE